jgi:hypothetical protein
VVVDNARRMIGKNIDVVVTSVLQTTAGKMIFGRHIDLAAGAQGGQQSSSSISAGPGPGPGNGEKTSSDREREDSYRKTRPLPQAQQT